MDLLKKFIFKIWFEVRSKEKIYANFKLKKCFKSFFKFFSILKVAFLAFYFRFGSEVPLQIIKIDIFGHYIIKLTGNNNLPTMNGVDFRHGYFLRSANFE